MRILPINNFYYKQNISFKSERLEEATKKGSLDTSQFTKEELKILNDTSLMDTLDALGLLNGKVYLSYLKYFPTKVTMDGNTFGLADEIDDDEEVENENDTEELQGDKTDDITSTDIAPKPVPVRDECSPAAKRFYETDPDNPDNQDPGDDEFFANETGPIYEFPRPWSEL